MEIIHKMQRSTDGSTGTGSGIGIGVGSNTGTCTCGNKCTCTCDGTCIGTGARAQDEDYCLTANRFIRLRGKIYVSDSIDL